MGASSFPRAPAFTRIVTCGELVSVSAAVIFAVTVTPAEMAMATRIDVKSRTQQPNRGPLPVRLVCFWFVSNFVIRSSNFSRSLGCAKLFDCRGHILFTLPGLNRVVEDVQRAGSGAKVERAFLSFLDYVTHIFRH